MPLTQIGISAAINWQLARTVAGFADVTQGDDSADFEANALDTGVWNALFAAQYTLAAGGTQVADLATFTDLAGNAVAGDKVLAVIVMVTGAAADKLNVRPNGANGLQWFFANAAYGVNVPGGGVLLFSEGPTGPGTTIDATHKQLLLTNTGAAPLTVKLVALVSDT